VNNVKLKVTHDTISFTLNVEDDNTGVLISP